MSLRDVLLTFKPRLRAVPLPSNEGTVYVRELTAGEVIEFSCNQTVDPTAAVYKLIVQATVDEQGKAVFTAADTDAVANLPYQISNSIVDAILELSGLKDDAKKKPTAEPN